MGKTPEDEKLGGCVGIDQQTSQEKRHSEYKDPEGGRGFCKTTSEKELYGTIDQSAPPTDQSDGPPSAICIMSRELTERKCLRCGVYSFLW